MWLQLTGVATKAKLYEGVYESLLEPYEQAEAYGINNSPSTIQIEVRRPSRFIVNICLFISFVERCT